VKKSWEAAIYGIRPRRTFREAARYYIKMCEKRSLGRDVQDLKSILPYIGKLYLDQIHQGRLIPFIKARRKAGRSAGTINRTLAVVRRILHLAAGSGAMSTISPSWRKRHSFNWLMDPSDQVIR
jgi:site-specific recombinase XerD